MAVADLARRIEVRADSPRFLPGPPDEEILDSFVRDLFRKNGFRRDGVGGSDQARIISRILQGQDVVGLLPTGAGRSEEPTSELQSLMRSSYAVLCLKKNHSHLTHYHA